MTISPDGTHAVLTRSTSPSESALWLVDLTRGSAVPISSGHGRNDNAVWSPDSARVVFASDRDGPENLFVKSVGDASPEQPLFQSDVPFKNASSWSPDGQSIVITQLDPGTAQDVWLLSLPGSHELKPLVRNPTRDNGGPISPDGHWMAYISDVTGRFELYLQPFPEPGRKVQVSQQSASAVWWTRDGRQLLFLDDDLHSLWRVDVEPGATIHVGTPKRVATLPSSITSIDAMPDRQRFLAITPERTGIGAISLVQNWRKALDQKR